MTAAFVSLPFGALINAPLMWLGLGLASIPIIIHLLNRRRVRPVRWAAMNWLAAALKRHQRRLKVENWLLLLLRMAAIALLGLALARPILEDSKLAGALGGKRSVYLVLDNSYSTDAKIDARSVFELVRHQANRVLDSLGPDDAVAVVLTNDPAEGSTSGTLPYVLQTRTVGGEGAARAKEALAAGVRPRHAPARWAETLRKTQEQMAPEDVGRQVYIVTDFQARDWSAGGTGNGDSRLRDVLEEVLRTPAAVRIVDVGGTDRRNLAVVDIENLTDPAPFVGRPAQLAVTVANHGGKSIRGASLEVVVGETGYKRNLEVPEIPAADTNLRLPTPGTSIVRVDLPTHAFERPGVHIVRCKVDVPESDPGADALALDSERWFALDVRPQIRVVGSVDTSTNEEKGAAEDYLRGVYEGIMPGDDDSVPEDGLPWFFSYESKLPTNLVSRLRERADDPIDLVVLANAIPRDSSDIAQLKAFVNEGGGLLVMVGDKVGDHDMLNRLLYTQDGPSLLPRRFIRREVRERSTEGAAPFKFDMRTRENAHPVARPFTQEAAREWMARFPPMVWGRMPFEQPVSEEDGGDGEDDEPEPEPDDAMVLAYSDGKSAIVAGQFGMGRTLWVSTSVDNGWIAEAGWMFIPMLLHDSAMWLTEPRSGDRNLPVGGSVRVRAPVGARTLRLTVPGGNQVSPNPVGDAAEGAVTLAYRYDDIGMAGPWRFSYERARSDGDRETVTRLLAVNVDPSEGALHAARQEDVAGSSFDGLDLTFATSFESDGEELDEASQGELTRWILWIVLAFLLIESILALRFGRRSVAPDEPTEGSA